MPPCHEAISKEAASQQLFVLRLSGRLRWKAGHFSTGVPKVNGLGVAVGSRLNVPAHNSVPSLSGAAYVKSLRKASIRASFLIPSGFAATIS
jgi:hypothetical protein